MPHALPNELEAPVFTALFHRESTPRCPLFRLWDHFSSISAFNNVLSRASSSFVRSRGASLKPV
jgi:hypothetical protein